MVAGALVAAVLFAAFNRDAAFSLLAQRATENRNAFYLYRDADSGLNHGFPSGFFGALDKIGIDAACIDDPSSSNGCSSDVTRFDRARGNVLRISFAPFAAGEFAGVNIEEPENWSVRRTGKGYDLRNATAVVFDIRSPTPGGVFVKFGVAESTTAPIHIAQSAGFTTMTIPLQSMNPPIASLQDVHVLFTVTTNDVLAIDGGTVLIDNVRFTPTPSGRANVVGFPVANETFGVIPSGVARSGRVPIPIDQVIRNLSPIYESSLALEALLDRPTTENLAAARVIADAFDYALRHENHGLPLPASSADAAGLHSAYESGDLALFNGQGADAGQEGDVRLAGFSASPLCDPSRYCLVLDGSTGGNVSFAMLALIRAWESFGDERYLDDARSMGRWVGEQLTDRTNSGFGGYYLGFPDEGAAKVVVKGKSIENNADLFVAFTRLAAAENLLGKTDAAADWAQRANVAGDFVLQLFAPDAGRFYAGTVPAGTASAPGLQPDGPRRGDDVINTFDFVDSNTFTVLALAQAPRYRSQIDWRRPIDWVAQHSVVTVTSGGRTWTGFNIVPVPTAGPPGVAWEFTGQVVVAMRLVDCLYHENRFAAAAARYSEQIALAQQFAPFGDGAGTVAATMQNGEQLPPAEHCLSTPFQCIPQRVGLAATLWSIFATDARNPLSSTASLAVCSARQHAVSH